MPQSLASPGGSTILKTPLSRSFHAMYCVVLPVALPLIMSVYLGVAESAAQKARTRCCDSVDPVTPYIIGEMETALTTARVMVEDMVRISDGYEFSADTDTVNEMVKRKTVAAEACKSVCAKALEACGGPGFMRANGIENLLRHYIPEVLEVRPVAA